MQRVEGGGDGESQKIPPHDARCCANRGPSRPAHERTPGAIGIARGGDRRAVPGPSKERRRRPDHLRLIYNESSPSYTVDPSDRTYRHTMHITDAPTCPWAGLNPA